MKTLVSLCILFFMSQGHAAQEGHGGAGFCVMNKCMTLAEAGFRLPPPGTPLEIEPEVIAELEKIISLLPKLSFSNWGYPVEILSLSQVIGEPGDISFVVTADPRIVAGFTQQYQQLLGAPLTTDFRIFGFTASADRSTQLKTFLILDLYKSLTTARSKALLLVHEYNLRSRRKSLAEAVVYDGVLVDYLSARESNQWANFDHWSFSKTMLPDHVATTFILGDIVHRHGDMTAEDLLALDGGIRSTKLVLNYAKILQGRKFDPRFSAYFKPGPIEIDGTSRGSILSYYIDETVKNSRGNQATFSRQKFAEFISKGIARSSFSEDAVRNLRQCGAIQDESIRLFARPEEFGFWRAKASICAVNDWWGVFAPEVIRELSPYIRGLDLTISGSLVCDFSSPGKVKNGPFCREVN